MKIGVISDIHSNLFALQKVISEIKKHDVSIIINSGDNVGYSVFPDECIQILRDERIYSVMGNYDDAVANDRPVCGCGYGDTNTQRIRLASLKWTQANINEKNKFFLKHLPKIFQMESGGENILAIHGGLEDLNEFIYKHDNEKLNKITQTTNADIIIMGHTHKSFILNLSGRLFVNPGSVGKPEDGNPESSYAVVDLEDFKADIYRTSYDVERNIEYIKKAGLPEEIIENLRTGISFTSNNKSNAVVQNV